MAFKMKNIIVIAIIVLFFLACEKKCHEVNQKKPSIEMLVVCSEVGKVSVDIKNNFNKTLFLRAPYFAPGSNFYAYVPKKTSSVFYNELGSSVLGPLIEIKKESILHIEIKDLIVKKEDMNLIKFSFRPYWRFENESEKHNAVVRDLIPNQIFIMDITRPTVLPYEVKMGFGTPRYVADIAPTK